MEGWTIELRRGMEGTKVAEAGAGAKPRPTLASGRCSMVWRTVVQNWFSSIEKMTPMLLGMPL